jgi:uncharacterized membrane protein YkoI
LIVGFTGRLMAATSMRALMHSPPRPRHALPRARVLATLAAACLGASALLAPAALAGDDDDVRRAREAVASGDYVALETLIADALRRIPGQVVDVDLDIDDDEYEIEVLDEHGVVWELEYDARTGRLTDVERDD